MRGAYFNTFYTNITEIVDNHSLDDIINYIKGRPKKIKLSVPTYGTLGLVRDLN